MSRGVKASFGLGFTGRSFLYDWRREHVFLDQSLSQINPMGQIDFQNGNRCAPDRSPAFKKRAVPQKVLPPPVAAWMKKRDNALGETVTSRDVRPFMVVAREACQRQVLGSSQPSVLTRQDVINLKREFVVLLRQPAILTGSLSAPPDQTFETNIHRDGKVAPRVFLRALRAFDFRRDNT